MVGMKELKSRKAGISIEYLMSAVLGLGVLFLTLGMFCNNVEGMTANGGINNLFKNKKATDNQSFNRDYTNNQVTVNQTQQDVRIVSEQGLDWYISQAQKTIDDLAKLPQPLTDPVQIKNLAEALTIATIGNSNPRIPDSDRAIASENPAINIKISYNGNCYTSFNGGNINWSLTSNSFTPSDDEKIATIKDVQGKFHS